MPLPKVGVGLWAETGVRMPRPEALEIQEGRMTRLPKRVLYRIALAGSSVLALAFF